MTFKLDNLPFALDALNPFMSTETLEYHYGKHHLAYVTNLNNFLENSPLKGETLENIIKTTYDKKEHAPIFNNAAQHFNHIEFWNSLKKNPNAKIPEAVNKAVEKDFGSFDAFKEQMIKMRNIWFGLGLVS